MKVFLVRHAVAHERSRTRWPNDSLRPLTPAGKRKFRKAARGLMTLLPKSAVLLTSPYVRARDTAAILAKVMRHSKPIECHELASGQPPEKAFELLRSRKDQTLVLVGHEPGLSNFLSAALTIEHSRLRIEFKKGGAACIDFPGRVEPARATLEWLAPPRMLRALK